MELHKALRHVIQAEGTGIVKDLRLANILSDLNAYDQIQGAKYILRAIINDNYTSQLLQLGKYDYRYNNLVQHFISSTGFDSSNATQVFNALVFGLGWIDTLPCASSTSQPQSQSQSQSNNGAGQGSNLPPAAQNLMLTSSKIIRKSQDFIIDYCQRAAEYLDSIVEVKDDISKKWGVRVKVFSQFTVYANPSSNIIWNVEVHGDIPMKKSDIIMQCFEILLYDHKGRLLGTKEVYTHNTINSFSVLKTEPVEEEVFKCVGNIGKIVIYAKKR